MTNDERRLRGPPTNTRATHTSRDHRPVSSKVSIGIGIQVFWQWVRVGDNDDVESVALGALYCVK
jgi:hypothetical protein